MREKNMMQPEEDRKHGGKKGEKKEERGGKGEETAGKKEVEGE